MAIGQLFKRIKEIPNNMFKGASASSIKTTSKISGSSAPIVSGGSSIVKDSAKNFAKGVGSTAKIGGKVIGGTAIVAIPAAAGIYGLDKFKNTLARQDDYYQTKDSNKNYSDETQNLKDRLDVLEKIQDSPAANDSSTNNFFEGGSTTDDQTDKKTSSNTPLLIGAGIAALIGGYFLLRKKKKV